MSIMQLTQTIQIMPPSHIRPAKHLVQPTLPGLEPETSVLLRVTNRQIAEVLAGVADLLATQNSNPYRIQAYRHAARGVLDLQEPVVDILARGETLLIPGLGQRLRARIAELVQTGSMTFSKGFCVQTLPVGVRAMMAVKHVGPYTAIRFYEELGIDSPEKLWQAAQQHHIRRLPGFGVRSEARLEKAAHQLLKGSRHQQPLGGVA